MCTQTVDATHSIQKGGLIYARKKTTLTARGVKIILAAQAGLLLTTKRVFSKSETLDGAMIHNWNSAHNR